MATIRQTHVIVGIVDSLAGLRAVREAVALARSHGAQLIAVKSRPQSAFGTAPFHGLIVTSQLYGLGLYHAAAYAQQETERLQRITQNNTFDEIRQVFDMALGGMPGDISVRLMTTTDRLDTALVRTAHNDGDLIVLPIDKYPPWKFSWRAARLNCPVLLAPVHEFARNIGRRHHIDPESIIAAHDDANRR